jgi:stage II sporulation protein D
MVRSGACLAAALAAACAGAAPQPRTVPSVPAPEVTLRVRLASGRIVELPIENYVRASILTELAPVSRDPAALARVFEVQAVLARTFALTGRGRHGREGFDLCATTHCQLVDLDRPAQSRWREVAEAAARATAGRALHYEGRPALTLFHADCGGHRSAAGEVWGGRERPYLTGGADPLPDGSAHAGWRFQIARNRLRDALDRDPLTSPGSRLDRVEVFRRDAAGRAALVLLAGERAPVVRGEELRAALARALGAAALKSTRFTVRQDEDRIEFVGQGLGHGVGLCQRGAMKRAEAGESVEQILQFYYPGTVLDLLRDTPTPPSLDP